MLWERLRIATEALRRIEDNVIVSWTTYTQPEAIAAEALRRIEAIGDDGRIEGQRSGSRGKRGRRRTDDRYAQP